MKKIFLCLLAFFTQCIAADTEALPQIKKEWKEDDKCFYLCLSLEEGLEFGKEYDTYRRGENATCAKISIVPSRSANFLSKDGYPLKDIQLEVELIYDPLSHVVSFLFTDVYSYKQSGWFTTKTSESTVTKKGYLSDLDLNLSTEAKLGVDTVTKVGYLSFEKR